MKLVLEEVKIEELRLKLIMENKYFKLPHQGPSWSHFKARYLYKKKLVNANLQNEKNNTEKKKKTTSFSWIMDTVNPLNHLPNC